MFLIDAYISTIRHAPYGKFIREPTADACELIRYLDEDTIYRRMDYYTQLTRMHDIRGRLSDAETQLSRRVDRIDVINGNCLRIHRANEP